MEKTNPTPKNIQVDTTPVFTRYLYVKNDVVWSLIISMLEQKVDESLFWGYELYYSGLKQLLIKLLEFLYEEFYRHVNSPKIDCFIKKKIQEWKSKHTDDTLIATLIANIACRPSDKIAFLQKYGNSTTRNFLDTTDKKAPTKPKKIVYMMYEKKDIEVFQTMESSREIRSYRILRHACYLNSVKNAYSLLNYVNCPFLNKYKLNIDRKTLTEMYRGRWEYYAYFTPVWLRRISKYLGTADCVNKRILFPDDDMEDLFYEEYGYEPDEQPLEVYRNAIEKLNSDFTLEQFLGL